MSNDHVSISSNGDLTINNGLSSYTFQDIINENEIQFIRNILLSLQNAKSFSIHKCSDHPIMDLLRLRFDSDYIIDIFEIETKEETFITHFKYIDRNKQTNPSENKLRETNGDILHFDQTMIKEILEFFS